jgi:Flp pilus assembly protein TadD
LTLDPRNPELLVLSARAALLDGDVSSAERAGADAVAAAPASFDARVALGQAYAKSGGLGRARQLFEQLAASQPDSAAARTAVGVMWQAQGRDDSARTWYAKALALDPKDGVAARNLAEIMNADGSEPDAAARLARTAVDERPGDARAHQALGWALFKSGRPGLAVTELERAGTLNPAEPLYRRQLADARRALEPVDK